MPNKEAARVEPGGGDAAGGRRQGHHSTARRSGQGKRGARGPVTRRGRWFEIGGQRVARTRGAWLYRRLASREQLFQGRAVAFRREILALARPLTPRGVCVVLPDGTVATASWATWACFGFDFEHPTFGPQRALPLARWYRPGGPRVWQAALRLGGGE